LETLTREGVDHGDLPLEGRLMPLKPADSTSGWHSPLRVRPVHPLRIKVPGGVTQRPGGKSTVIERYGVHICSVVVVFGGMLGGLLLKGGAMPEPWSSVADVAGWSYFFAWSLSFYPQLYLNWRRKSVVGFSFDFALTNVLGFACLAIYYCSFYFDRSVREQYRASHNGADNAVRENDVFFALHALLLTCLTLAQVGIYERGNQQISSLCAWAVGGAMAVIVFYAGLLAAFPRAFDALTFLYLLSYIKVLVTASKYIPQALLNYRRRALFPPHSPQRVATSVATRGSAESVIF